MEDSPNIQEQKFMQRGKTAHVAALADAALSAVAADSPPLRVILGHIRELITGPLPAIREGFYLTGLEDFQAVLSKNAFLRIRNEDFEQLCALRTDPQSRMALQILEHGAMMALLLSDHPRRKFYGTKPLALAQKEYASAVMLATKLGVSAPEWAKIIQQDDAKWRTHWPYVTPLLAPEQ